MHKIFAKPLFLGKKVVFLPQCHSTNDELSHLIRKGNEPEGLVVYTDHQTSGKGQRGNIWVDEGGKNVLLSLLLRPSRLQVSDQFFLNVIVGLAVIQVLEDYSSATKSLKWPNDIYLNEKKLGGILIENNIKGGAMESAVVGLGLNVNQRGFNMPNATSIFLETQCEFDREDIIDELLSAIEQWYLRLSKGEYDQILTSYYDKMMWKDEERLFQSGGYLFKGKIRGIDANGRLVIETSEGERKFRTKEVAFVQ